MSIIFKSIWILPYLTEVKIKKFNTFATVRFHSTYVRIRTMNCSEILISAMLLKLIC